MQLVAGDERPCPSGGADFCVPIQQQVASFPVAGGRCAVCHGLLLLDFHLFLQVCTGICDGLWSGPLLDRFRVLCWRDSPAAALLFFYSTLRFACRRVDVFLKRVVSVGVV